MTTLIPRPVKRGSSCPTRQHSSPANTRQLDGKRGNATDGLAAVRGTTAMSSSSPNHLRNVLNNGRGAPSPNERVSSRARLPSSQVGAQEWPSAPSPRSPPNSHKPHKSGSDLGSSSGGREVRELRTEKGHVTIVDKVTIRTRSPVKEPRDGRTSKKKSRDTPSTGAGDMVLVGRSPARSSDRDSLWEPCVSLVPPTTAPLASRVAAPPLAYQAPFYLQPQPLGQLSHEEQEAAILDDLLFVFMGLEGQYIRYSHSYDPRQESDRLAGPEFSILPGLDPSLRDLTTTLLKMATHYSAVNALIDDHSQDEFGVVNHALCASMRRYLDQYLDLVAELENQLLVDPGFTLHLLHLRALPMSHDFSQLYTLSQEILRRNDMLGTGTNDPMDALDDVQNILDRLRDGGDLMSGGLPVKKIFNGGGVLGLLRGRLASMSGDPAARTLLTGLLRDASRPYMTMLNEWLHHGDIKDSHSEFIIREQHGLRRDRLEQDYTDEYWEKRYTIRGDNVPPQLESVKEKVLLAGKYLNVVRECGGVDTSREVQDVPETFDDPRFLDNVNEAYAYANSSLLNLLLTTHALPARLRSLKHYFILDQSDFFSYFLELGVSELEKPVNSVNVSKLQSLLDLVLRQPGSVAAQDPYKEDVKVQMNEMTLTKWLMRVVTVTGIDGEAALNGYQTSHAALTARSSSTAEADKCLDGFSALELDYSVPFPLSLVIGRKTVLRYQLLFRYLLSLRHLESRLIGSWHEHNKTLGWRHQSSDRRLEVWKRRAWTLRARMLVFIQQLLYFCTSEVIEPNWQSLMARIEGGRGPSREGIKLGTTASKHAGGRTVDELMQDHVDFLDTCLKECMLTNPKLLRIQSKIISTCTMYATFTGNLHRAVLTADPDLTSHPQPVSAPPSEPANDPPPSGARRTAARASANPPAYQPTRLGKLSDNLQRYEENFSRHLRIFLDSLNWYAHTETSGLLGLCSRLSMASEGVGFDPGAGPSTSIPGPSDMGGGGFG